MHLPSLLRINKQLLVIKDELMDEESITLELEQLPWYIQLEGKKNEWSLRFVFEIKTKQDLLKCIGRYQLHKIYFMK